MPDLVAGLLYWIILLAVAALVLAYLMSRRNKSPLATQLQSVLNPDPWQTLREETAFSEAERRQVDRAAQLLAEVRRLTRAGGPVPEARQRPLKTEIDRLEKNLLGAFNELAQLLRVQDLIEQPDLRAQVERLHADLTQETDRSVAILEEVVVGVASIGVRKDQRDFERLLGDLSDSSSKLRDYLSAYEEVVGRTE